MFHPLRRHPDGRSAVDLTSDEIDHTTALAFDDPLVGMVLDDITGRYFSRLRHLLWKKGKGKYTV